MKDSEVLECAAKKIEEEGGYSTICTSKARVTVCEGLWRHT